MLHPYDLNMKWQANTWHIFSCGDYKFKIKLKGNENTEDGYSQSDWILSSLRQTETDKRNKDST